jgi:hypothetical protein
VPFPLGSLELNSFSESAGVCKPISVSRDFLQLFYQEKSWKENIERFDPGKSLLRTGSTRSCVE